MAWAVKTNLGVKALLETILGGTAMAQARLGRSSEVGFLSLVCANVLLAREGIFLKACGNK